MSKKSVPFSNSSSPLVNSLAAAFGLSEREKTAFSVLLDNGQLPASSVARLCEMPRNTVRGTLDNLVKRGLVSCSRRANTQFYCVERSDSLLKVLTQRREALNIEIEGQIDLIKKHNVLFERPEKLSSRPKISFYDGYDGLKKVYEDTLTTTGPIRAWASFDSNRQALPRYFDTYYSRRAKKKISITAIIEDTPLSRSQTKTNSKYLRKCVLVPSRKFSIGPEVQVYENKVNIVSWKEKLGIIIESSEVAAAISAIFDLSYNSLLTQYEERK